ncbi:MAG: VPLPA-CTERM sorting domain-containing protein [Pseudomonadota bacterium]
MISKTVSALTAAVLASSVQAATLTTDKTCEPAEVRVDTINTGSSLDGELGITRCDAVTTIDAITEVVLAGLGPDQTFSYSSLASAPGPADTGIALTDALGFFGYPLGQPVAGATLSLFDTVVGPSTEDRSAIVSTPGTVIVGDLSDDPDTIIVLTGRLDLEFTTSFDVTNRYRLSVDLAPDGSGSVTPSPTPIPLPATAPLLLFGLGGLVALRRKSKSGVEMKARIHFIAAIALGLASGGTAQAATVTTDKTCGPTEVRVDTINTGSSLNGELGITRCDAVTTIEAITEVVLAGLGPDQTFTYPSLASAPGPADTGIALTDALGFFGYPLGQPVAGTTLSLFDTVVGPSTEDRSAIVSTPGTAFIGDLDNPDGIIVVAGRLDFEFTTRFDITNRYRLSVDLQNAGPGPNPSPPTPIPLPATALLLLGGLAGLRLSVGRGRAAQI